MLRFLFLGLIFATVSCVTTPAERPDIDFEISKSTLTTMSADMKKAKTAETPVDVANLGCWKDKCRIELTHEDGKVGTLGLTPEDLKTLLAAISKSKVNEPLDASSGSSSVSCTPNECKFSITKDIELDPKADFWVSDLLGDLKSQAAKPASRKKK